MSRLGTLNSLATHMNSVASKLDRSYNIAKETMSNLNLQFQVALQEQQNVASSHIRNEHIGTLRRLVRDPIFVRMKGCRDSNFLGPSIQRHLGNKYG